MGTEAMFGLSVVCGVLFIGFGICTGNSKPDSQEQVIASYLTGAFFIISIISFLAGIVLELLN